MKDFSADENGDTVVGASEQQLVEAEIKLKIQLPPSYRAYLKTAKGGGFLSNEEFEIRSIENVRWFRKEHKDWYEAYQMSAEPICILEKDYFDYTKQDSVVFDIKHLAETLCISEVADESVLLLNPMVVWPEGEWEVWRFSNSSPGATRFRSFADWMNSDRRKGPVQAAEKVELPVVYLDGPAKPNRRIRPREKIPILEVVLKKLKSAKDNERIKAAKQLGLLGGSQAVEALLSTLKTDPIKEVRWAATDSLSNLAVPEAIAPLIEAVNDPLVNSSAVHALRSFNDEISAQFLLKTLQEGGCYASQAGYVLSLRGDLRAIKPMTDSLVSKAKDRKATWHHLEAFGEPAFNIIEPLTEHADLEIRTRVESCLCSLAHHAKDKKVRLKAFNLLQKRLAVETDIELKKSLERSVQICAKRNRA